jgi:Flp pilus assembly protein TadG
MQVRRQHIQNHPAPADRQGTATVEFAVVVPLFLTLILGIAEMSNALNYSQNMSAAVREGGREAAGDLSKITPSGTTYNQKVINDVKNMLCASGIDPTKVTVTITYADGAKAGQTFDLSNSNNYLLYFKITAQVDYKDISSSLVKIMSGKKLTASAVFRLGYSTLSS